MPFKKGHNGHQGGGRPKGSKNGYGKKKNQSLDVYRNHHKWDTTRSKRTLDPELVDYYINNDLDLNELYDDMKLYNYDDNGTRWKLNKK